ncbi:MAG: hypothetical protein ACOC70_02145, partial [bacterium]
MRLSSGVALAGGALLFCLPSPAGEDAERKKPATEWKRWERPRYERGSPYPELMSEVALSAEELPRVVEGHPRLLLRAKPWAGGLCVAELRKRAGREPWSKMVPRWKSPKYAARCALYYLITGDESVVPALVEAVLKARPAHRCGGGLVEPCMVYDRIIGSPSLTDEQKTSMRAHLVKVVFQCARAQESSSVNDMWHHRGAAGWASDVLVTGLTLAGEHPEAKRLLAWGAGYFRRNYFRGWARTGGTHMGGGHRYYRAGAGKLPLAIACWHSAAEPDVCVEIRDKWNDFLQGNMYAMMYQTLPDGTRVESTGFDRAPRHLMQGNYMLTGWCYKNPDAYAFVRWVARHNRRHGGRDPKDHILLYDPEVDKKAAALPLSGPSARFWGGSGRGWFGYVQIRSNGWQPDSTVIEFKCGDRFWSHGFNTNQNAFYIYRKGRLAPHTGYYSDRDHEGNYRYFGQHMRNYYCQTVASNSVLVIDPQEWAHCRRRVMATQDEDGYYPVYGSQRLHRGGSNCFSFDEFLARMTAPSNPFECGDIVAFEHAPDFSFTYVCGDATANYNNPRVVYHTRDRENRPKLDLFTRSLAWLGNRHLVVFDRINALDASFRKAWLLHSLGKPRVSGKRTKVEVPGHIERFDGDLVTIDWQGTFIPTTDPKNPGRLFSKTLLPRERVIRRIGGKGHEFWAGGRNWEPLRVPTRENPGSDPMDVGAWRVEVSPREPATFDHFLHVLY